MAEKEAVESLKIEGDINHSLSIYVLEDLYTEDEVDEGIRVISSLCQEYRHIHVELRTKLGETYKEQYPKYDEIVGGLIKFIKSAKSKLRNLRESAEKRVEEKTNLEQEKEINALKFEEELLALKISQVEDSVEISVVENVHEIDSYIGKIEGFIDEYFTLSAKLKFCLGESYENLYASKLKKCTSDMHQNIKMAKIMKQKIIQECEKFGRLQVEKVEQGRQIKNAEILRDEIFFRCNSLRKKYDNKFEGLSDYKILEINKDKTLDLEFNGILEKFTALAALAPGGVEGVQKIVENALGVRDEFAKLRENFLRDLEIVVSERDITPDKMKNASGLKIEIPKFSGYDSKIDYYTFKSQFQKLIEPTVQKKYWADYLKCNYLSGSALVLVEKETDYSNIWAHLLESFGNARLLLQNKLGALDKIGGLWKVKGDEKIGMAIARLVNAMKDLSSLACEHHIEGQLYEGGGLEKIMTLIGEYRHRKFRSQNLGLSVSKKEEWGKLLKFLQQELQLREKLALDHKTAQLMGISSNKNDSPKYTSEKSKSYHATASELKCHICEKVGHAVVITAKGKKIIPYYVCETFASMSPAERLAKLKSKNLCVGCLFPGAMIGPRHKCYFTNYFCPNLSHEHGEKLHILLCDKHKKEDANIKLLEKFKDKFINNCKVSLPQCSKHLSLFSEMVGVSEAVREKLNTSGNYPCEPVITESAIFQLQTIELEGLKLNLFFDSGCGDMVVKKAAVDRLISMGRAKQVFSGPIELTGVGGKKSICDDGMYSVRLPLHNGRDAVLCGLCMPKITTEFPLYNLCEVEKEIRIECENLGGGNLVSQLPKLPPKVGGDTDILIGIKYIKYFPKKVFELKTGLSIYESVFLSTGGTRGVVGGPHREFSKAEKDVHVSESAYFQVPVCNLRTIWKLENEMPLLGMKAYLNMRDIDKPICCEMAANEVECAELVTSLSLPSLSCDLNDAHSRLIGSVEMACVHKTSPKCVRQFDQIENAGTEVTYRCVDCRSCLKCKNGSRFDATSIQEEIEQGIIERSVSVNVDRGITTAKLPFVADPDSRLVPNENEALKVYRGQIKKLNKNPDDLLAVIESERKLQILGFVEYVSNLNEREKNLILSSKVKYFIPWRAVWNEKSVSTPCRLVFDASQGTKGGCSLNSLLAKGANSLNKLVEILIRWTIHNHAFHTDIQKMYNAIRLDKMYWRYQLYLWGEGLKENEHPQWKVIKTLIYGVRSSGNLAEYGLRLTAEICKSECPEAYDVITYDTYMDDCLSGTKNCEETERVTDQLQVAVGKGGFTLKGFTISGSDPPDHLSKGQDFVVVGGLKWFPKGDFLKINIGELNFNKKVRGKKSAENTGVIPDKLTKRDCISKVAEVFDPLGRVAPILGGMKLDISILHQRCLNWDDPIPNELKNIWAANFDLIKEIGNIRFERAIVPKDAVNLEVETIDTADASENLICAAVYARFKRRNGKFSCQLIFSRTKIVHDISIPRAELVAAVMNASTGHIVQKSLRHWHKRSWKLTDSQVVLHWINCTKTGLKMWVRNRVVEITRLVERSAWRYVSSKNMVADLGTRKGAKIEDVGPDSCWIQGLSWMREDAKNFPLKTVSEIGLSSGENSEANKEKILDEIIDCSTNDVKCLTARLVPEEVGERYKFSRYLINPNKFRFRTVIRILGLVFLFIRNISRKKLNLDFLKTDNFGKVSGKTGEYVVHPINVLVYAAESSKVAVVHLPAEVLNAAKNYFFRKTASEVKAFVDPIKYENKSVCRDGILYYTGRILPMQEIEGRYTLGDACLDLSAATFCVPITDAHSPVAYAIVSETHWYDPNVSHGGVESVLRYSQNTAYIIGGRALVKDIKKGCAKCRILHKKGVRVAMGPVGVNNLNIAPPFYFCQVDICGPYNAYSPVNKRASLKVWFVVFCCTISGAVDCRIMENYTSDAFVVAFVRFSCRFGYPKILMPDEGSQLVKGCQNMVISFTDIQHKIVVEFGVDFKTCPVGAHYVHGKVERKIQEIKRSLRKSVDKCRLSVLQWETLGQQISNSINNMPIGLGNKTDSLENLDILTPNRLILGRNNSRNPTAPLEISHDLRHIIESNNKIFQSWFSEWLISYVPILIQKPKWFKSERSIDVGDVVLFLKSEREFDRQYQYGIVASTIIGRDGNIRVVEIEYQNHSENVKRITKRGVRDIIVIHPIDEIGISRELQEFADTIQN